MLAWRGRGNSRPQLCMSFDRIKKAAVYASPTEGPDLDAHQGQEQPFPVSWPPGLGGRPWTVGALLQS